MYVAMNAVSLAAGGMWWSLPGPLEALALLVALSAATLGIVIRRDTASMATKFVARAGQALNDYRDGVQAAGPEWESRTVESEANFEAGVQQAIADKRFGRGVRGSGQKFQVNAVTLGVPRYGPGVTQAKEAWARGVQPAIDALKALTLPPKGPKRSPQNMQRAQAVVTTLSALVTGK